MKLRFFLLPAFLACLLLARSSPVAEPGMRLGAQPARQSSTPVVPYSLPSFPLNHTIQMPIRLCDLYDLDDSKHDPIYPSQIGNMVQGPTGDDNFYSTSQFGGNYKMGTIFAVTVTGNSASVKVLYHFGEGKLKDGGQFDANGPRGGLSLGRDGALYGTTTAGGKYNAGTIFKIARSGGDPTLLYSFRNGTPDRPAPGQPPPVLSQQQKDDIAAAVPWSAPLMGLDGNLYGVATVAEGTPTGVLYQLSGTNLKSVHRFTVPEKDTFGLVPISLTRGWDGEFYGVTWAGGLGQGTIFRFDPSAQSGPHGGVITLYRISNIPPHVDGSNPYTVMEGFDRNLYGVMSAGGPYYRGVVFHLTQGGTFDILHAFGGTDARPGPGLVEVLQNDPQQPGKRDYYLYGAASWNYSIPARFNTGILFRVREHPPQADATGPDPYGFSTVYNTDGTGSTPSTTPVHGRDSNLYGTMAGGGAHTFGSFYRLNTSYEATGDSGTLTYTNPDGQPHTRVVLMGDPGGKSVIYDDRYPIQVVTHVAVFAAGQSDVSKAQTSDGITVRVKDIPPFPYWPRPNALNDRAKIVQFFYRERFDSKNNPISGFIEEWNPLHSYYYGQPARYNNYLWLSRKNGNFAKPPANQDCVKADPDCAGNTDWTPAYEARNKSTGKFETYVESGGCNSSTQVCTSLAPPCTSDPYAVGAGECGQLSTPAKGHWIVDGLGRQPDKSGHIDPFYNPIDTEIDCDGVTLFDTPSLIRNGPLPRPAGSVMPNPDELQRFSAMDYVIIDNKVVASVFWVLEEKPNQDEDYTVVSIRPGPPSLAEQQCFAELMIHYHFSDAFPVPGETNRNIKCLTPYY